MSLEKNINRKINDFFKPSFFKIINFSDQHKNHYSGENKDTSHIKLIIVSEEFLNLSRIDRERKVHKVLEQDISLNTHYATLQNLSTHLKYFL